MTTIPTPRTQGLQSSAFTQPPLDGSLSVPALLDWQAIHSPLHPLFTYDEAPGSRHMISWNEGHQGIQRATKLMREKTGYFVQKQSNEDPPVVAILASADSITFATFLMGAWRSGCIIFPLSPHNSPVATAALLQQTGTSHVFVSSDKPTRELCDASMKNIRSGFSVKIHDMPTFHDLYPAGGSDATFVFEESTEVNMGKTAFILHSSGTTAFPKPIYLTHWFLVVGASTFCFRDTDLTGKILACHSVPMFHSMGSAALLMAVATGIILSFFKPQYPPVTPSPAHTFEGAITSDYVLTPPAFLEAWSKDRRMVEALARTRGILHGGGPLTKGVGDALASHGVKLHIAYGSTETFPIGKCINDSIGMDWEYFEIYPVHDARFIDMGQNEFELVVLETDWYRPNVINCQIDGRNGYNTKDLVSPHPTRPGLWKIVGRSDDQIIHSTGEKTNPGPLEAILRRDPFVSGAVIFGRGKFQCGVLVEPKEAFKFGPDDVDKLNEFRSLIWPTIEEMNAFAPQHSRIFKEMILVASPSKPFQYTSKGSLCRKAIIDDYAPEIKDLYANWRDAAQGDDPVPSEWDLSRTKVFIRQLVEKIGTNKNRTISDDADLFKSGFDSLQATWMRNVIQRALRESQASLPSELPTTFVYDNPTIARLSEYVSALVRGLPSARAGDVSPKHAQLISLVDKYAGSFPHFQGRRNPKPGIVVLLTGATGSLGSNILAKLLQDHSVIRVYAMSRPSSFGMSTKERHQQAFEREGLDKALLNNLKVRFFDGDAEKADFGIDQALYEEMQSTATHIIHNAWRVNFDVALPSFEPNIRSVRNFVDFALGSILQKPPRILFISSISVLQSCCDNIPAPEEHLPQPDSAIGSGYGESKWVSEQILRRASEETPLSSTVIRCGQMTGGPSGAWNSHEWFPSLIKSSIALGKLPDVEGSVSWVTAYDAAAAVLDMLDTTNDVLHIISPNRASWSSVLTAFARELKLPVVPYSAWLGALEDTYSEFRNASNDAGKVELILRENPALRLMDIFKAAARRPNDRSDNPFDPVAIENEKAVQVSPALRQVQPVTAKDVGRWVSYWRRTGFLPQVDVY